MPNTMTRSAPVDAGTLLGTASDPPASTASKGHERHGDDDGDARPRRRSPRPQRPDDVRALPAAMGEAPDAPARVAVLHRHLDLDDAGTGPHGVDRHRHLETEPVGLGDGAQQVGPDRALARQRGADFGAAGAPDPAGGEALDRAETAAPAGGRKHADGEVGVAGEDGIEQPVGRRRRRRQIGVDEQEDLGVGAGGDTGGDGAALPAVVGQPEDVGPGAAAAAAAVASADPSSTTRTRSTRARPRSARTVSPTRSSRSNAGTMATTTATAGPSGSGRLGWNRSRHVARERTRRRRSGEDDGGDGDDGGVDEAEGDEPGPAVESAADEDHGDHPGGARRRVHRRRRAGVAEGVATPGSGGTRWSSRASPAA